MTRREIAKLATRTAINNLVSDAIGNERDMIKAAAIAIDSSMANAKHTKVEYAHSLIADVSIIARNFSSDIDDCVVMSLVEDYVYQAAIGNLIIWPWII